MRLLLVTDAWQPQVNGVVRTLNAVCEQLAAMGDEVRVAQPGAYKSIPCPTYPEIRLAFAGPGAIGQVIDTYRPSAIHIATEGPLGLAARRLCLRRRLPFTTAFHTRFPEYVEARTHIPADWTYPIVRHFHRPSSSVMAPTQTVVDNLISREFKNVRLWGRGVDINLFKPGPKADIPGHRPGNEPVLLYVGRVAVEKNIGAFLNMDHPGKKVVVGDGPMMGSLKSKYPDIYFAGAKHGAELAAFYNAADVFVFPSLTDTFGLVMLEAMATGKPVAAYPVMGPLDVITDPKVGVLNKDLATATAAALELKPDDCCSFAECRSWRASAETFRSYLHQFDQPLPLAVEAPHQRTGAQPN